MSCERSHSQWTVSDLLADGDRVAARTTWSGTYQAPEFRGVTVPGPARFAVEHVHIYRISDEKMIEHWVVRDEPNNVAPTRRYSDVYVLTGPVSASTVSPTSSGGCGTAHGGTARRGSPHRLVSILVCRA